MSGEDGKACTVLSKQKQIGGEKMAVFPSKDWVEAVLEAAKKSEAYQEAAKDWEGDFLCIVEGDAEFLRELSRKEVMAGFISLIDMIPAQDRMKYQGTPTGKVFEAIGIPLDVSLKDLNADEVLSKVSKLSAGDVKGVSLYVWADFWHGAVRNMAPVAPGEHQDAAFKLSGTYSAWKLMVSGKQDTIRLIMSNKLQLQGNMAYMMKHMKAVVLLTKEVFAGVPID
ncbi:MAG: SCP2 sterol-binding domain-containing protein [Chloroflexi bacterium]|nr:SCP2 sterol-binding domain-containing protein [Chloroflexota bacterium]